jgi:hypothetical protein
VLPRLSPERGIEERADGGLPVDGKCIQLPSSKRRNEEGRRFLHPVASLVNDEMFIGILTA